MPEASFVFQLPFTGINPCPPDITYTEVFVFTVPLYDLQEGATHFNAYGDDGSQWRKRALWQFYLKVVEMTFAKHKRPEPGDDPFSFYIEGIRGGEEGFQRILAYRFYAFLNGTEGGEFASMSREVMNLKQVMMEAPGVTAKHVKNRLKNRNPNSNEFFYFIDSKRLFLEAVKEMTGFEIPQDGEMTTEALFTYCFSPEFQFVSLTGKIDFSNQLQEASNLYFGQAPNFAGSSLTFPAPDMVYCVPSDLARFENMYWMMLPQVQQDRYVANKLAPNILRVFSMDTAVDADDSERTQKRLRLMQEMGLKDFSRGDLETESFSAGGAAKPLTIYQEPASQNRDFLRKLEEFWRQTAPGGQHSDDVLQRVEPLLNFPVQFALGQKSKVCMCNSIRRIFVESGSVRLENLLASEGSSPVFKILWERAASLGDVSKVREFYETGNPNLSYIVRFDCKLVVFFELVFFVTQNHMQGKTAFKCFLDATRADEDLHLNCSMITKKGSAGKSMIMQLVLSLLVDGSWEEISSHTTMAFQTGGPDGNPDQRGCVYFMDELQARFLDPNGDAVTLKKNELSNGGHTKVRSFFQDDQGNRRTMLCEQISTGVWAFCGNKNNPDHAWKTRFVEIEASESGSTTSRRIDASMNEQRQNAREAEAMGKKFKEVMEFHQVGIFMLNRVFELGLMPEPSFYGASIFLNEFTKELLAKGYQLTNSRVMKHILSLSRIECMREALGRYFQVHQGPMTVKSMFLMERMLFVSISQVMSAIMELAPSIIPRVPFAVRCCLHDLYKQQVAQARSDPRAFQRLFHDSDGVQDFSYFSIPLTTLVDYAVLNCHVYMDGITPSKEKIKDEIRLMCSGMQRQYSRYAYIEPDLGGYAEVVEDGGPKHSFQCMRERETNVRGQMQVEAHMGYILETATSQTPREIILECMQIALNYKHQLPRTIVKEKDPRSAQLKLHTFCPTSSLPLTIQQQAVADTFTQSMLPNYQENVFPVDHRSSFQVNVDLDAYSLERRDNDLFAGVRGREGVTERVEEILSGTEEAVFFFGKRVSFVSTNDSSHFTPEVKRRLESALQDHVPSLQGREHLYQVEGLYHWNIVKETFNPRPFGFLKWEEDEGKLQEQYACIEHMECIYLDLDKRRIPFQRENFRYGREMHWDALQREGYELGPDPEAYYKDHWFDSWILEHRQQQPFDAEDYVIRTELDESLEENLKVYHWDVLKNQGHVLFKDLNGEALWQKYARERNNQELQDHLEQLRS